MHQLSHPSPATILETFIRLGFLHCLVSMSTAFDVVVIQSSQSLPPKCTEQFATVVKECPARLLPDDQLYWNQLSGVCCQRYPGTTLHCQHGPTNTGGFVYPACLPRSKVAKGYYAKLGKNSSGYPELKTYPCDRDSYEDTERPSDDLPYSYCTKPKTRCRGQGEQLFCRGGPAEDDRCVCREGYRPDPDDRLCRAGYFQDGECRCVSEPCPEGRARNESQTHDDVSCDSATEPDYSCYAGLTRQPVRTTTQAGEMSSSRHQGPATTSRPGSGSDDGSDSDTDGKKSDDGVFEWRLLVGVLIVLLALLVTGVTLWCLCKPRICSVIDAVKTRMQHAAPPVPPAAGADESLLQVPGGAAPQSRDDDPESSL